MPHRSRLHLKVTDHRTTCDFFSMHARHGRCAFARADLTRMVLDTLSTHSAGALYETFPALDAHRNLQPLEFHYTPSTASLLKMVEIEIGVLRGRCLDRPDPASAIVSSRLRGRGVVTSAQPFQDTHQVDVHHPARTPQAGPRLSGHCQRAITSASRSLVHEFHETNLLQGDSIRGLGFPDAVASPISETGGCEWRQLGRWSNYPLGRGSWPSFNRLPGRGPSLEPRGARPDRAALSG